MGFVSRTHVKSVIDAWDPIGLLSIGTPNDEYDPELNQIMLLADPSDSAEDLATKLYSVFLRMFGADAFLLTLAECVPIARQFLGEA